MQRNDDSSCKWGVECCWAGGGKREKGLGLESKKRKGKEGLGHELGLEGLWAKQGRLGLEDGIWDGWRVYVGVGK